MNDNPLVVITTRLPRAACGIGGYSALLREHWPDVGAVEFLVMDSAAEAAPSGAGDRVTEFGGDASRLARELERVGAADVILQYGARAYQRFGCPVRLPGVLASWKRRFARARLLVIVHELPGEMPMTSRHFWLGQVDVWIVRRLSAIADVLVTNTQNHADKLRRITARSDVQMLPVGSNIAVTAPPEAARDATEFVVFGLPFGRLQTLKRFEADVRRWHTDGRLRKLHIIGPETGDAAAQADALLRAWPATIEIVRHGMLPAREVSRVLRRARFVLTNVTAETWSKSGAFMACAAHGCAVVVAQKDGAESPFSLSLGSDEVESISASELDRRTAALARWYEENADWPVLARRMAARWQKGKLSDVA